MVGSNWDWDEPDFHIEFKTTKWVITEHIGFGSHRLICTCNKRENAEKIVKILEEDKKVNEQPR